MPSSLPRKPAASTAVRRRAEVASAGFAGDEAAVRAALDDEEPTVRAGALHALVRLGAATAEDAVRALSDPAPAVRLAACELSPRLPGADYEPLLSDAEAAVVEAAAFALGEVGGLGPGDLGAGAVARLVDVAAGHADPLCREAAVAAIGAIGDEAGKPAVLRALSDVPAVRRRAVVALAAFEGPEVEAALRARLEDRDWQVRQAAEDLLGR